MSFLLSILLVLLDDLVVSWRLPSFHVHTGICMGHTATTTLDRLVEIQASIDQLGHEDCRSMH
jgi:hypothetical protein